MIAKSDVAIIGAGLAGLQCALTLSERRPDLRIQLWDQAPVGGSARWAVGSFTAGGTKWQAAAGIQDSPAEHYVDLLRMCDFDGSEEDAARYRDLLRRMCGMGPSQLERLERQGVTFSGPYLEPPHRQARMHNAVPAASAVTEALLGCLRDKTNLTVDTDRAVVELGTGSGTSYRLTSRAGELEADAVVLASGDRSAAHPSVPSLNPGLRGKPLALASALLGARMHEPLYGPGLRTISPGGPYVAPTDQAVSAGRIRHGENWVEGARFLEAPDDFAGEELYLELDPAEGLADTYVCTYPGIGYATLQDLEAAGLAVPHTGSHGRRQVTVGPMQVVITLADGALDVDAGMRALTADGQPINGLWACGSAALGGIRLGGHGHHLLWAAVTGSAAALDVADAL